MPQCRRPPALKEMDGSSSIQALQSDLNSTFTTTGGATASAPSWKPKDVGIVAPDLVRLMHPSFLAGGMAETQVPGPCLG